MGTIPLGPESDAPLLELFGQLDSDHDGRISYQEYHNEFARRNAAWFSLL